MEIETETPWPIIVNVFCVNKLGPDYMVMAESTESNIPGPAYARTADGPVYMTVEGKFRVTHLGRHDPEAGVLFVAHNRPTSYIWEKGGVRYGIRVRHYLYP